MIRCNHYNTLRFDGLLIRGDTQGAGASNALPAHGSMIGGVMSKGYAIKVEGMLLTLKHDEYQNPKNVRYATSDYKPIDY